MNSAESYVKLAKKQLNKFWVTDENRQNAAEFYIKAGNLFSAKKDLINAMKSYTESAKLYEKLGKDFEFDAITSWISVTKAIDDENELKNIIMDIIVPYYITNGKFVEAGRQMSLLGDRLTDASDKIGAYLKSVEYYASASSSTSATSILCLEKIAKTSVSSDDIDTAKKTFEELADICITNDVLKFNVKQYLFGASLCNLALGNEDDYKSKDYIYADSSEAKFIDELNASIQNNDIDKFTDLCYQFDQTHPLEPWKTKLLLKTKQLLEENLRKPIDLT